MTREDNAMRARLRALAEEEGWPRLGAAARARVQARVHSVGSRGQGLHGWGFGLVAALGCGMAAALLWNQPPPATRELAVRGDEVVSFTPPVTTTSPVCAEHAAARFVPGPGAKQELDLGTRALLRAAPDTQITHEISPDCDVFTQMASGQVAVHARDLRGKHLVVSTPKGDIVVKGTLFEVSFEPGRSELRVSVDEGVVEVRAGDLGVFRVEGGRTLIVAERATFARFDGLARRTLRRSLDLSVQRAWPSQHPEFTPEGRKESERAQPEEKAWHAGSVVAPQLPPVPGSSLTEDGRPMAKPRVVHEGRDAR